MPPEVAKVMQTASFKRLVLKIDLDAKLKELAQVRKEIAEEKKPNRM